MWAKAPFIVLICIALVASGDQADQTKSVDPVLIEDSDGNWKLVRAHCTSCHSSQILKNLRLSTTAWQDVIKRMQEDEGLWDLGDDEPKIVVYLATYFGPAPATSQRRGRRAPLTPSNLSPQN